MKRKYHTNDIRLNYLLGNGFSAARINGISKIMDDPKISHYEESAKGGIEDYLKNIIIKICEDVYIFNNEREDFLQTITGGGKYQVESLLTTNFDPLLALYTMNSNYNDGFIKKRDNRYTLRENDFSSSNKINVGYLHGNITIYGNNKKAEKILWKDVKSSNSKYKSKIPPLALGHRSFMKKGIINEYDYLSTIWEYFCNIIGILIIYGFSFSKVDKHILQAIIKNKNIEAVYISWHCTNELSHMQKIQSRLEDSGKKVLLFHAIDFGVYTKNCFSDLVSEKKIITPAEFSDYILDELPF